MPTPKPKPPKASNKALNLTRQQEAWAHAYASHGSTFLAAQQAGYQGSEEAVRVAGSRNRANPRIQAYLEQIFEQRVMGRGEFEGRLADLARASVEVLLGEDGRVDLDKAKRHRALQLVRELTVTEEHGVARTKVKLHDSLKALSLIGDVLGVYAPQKIEHSGSVSLEDVRAATASLPPTRPEEEDD